MELASYSKKFVRAFFTNRGFSRILSSVDPVSSDSSLIEDIADIVRNLSVSKKDPSGFDSVMSLFGLEYVGYIIDKERLDTETNQWIRTDEYKIIGSSAANFKDSRVAYGYVYRYRIRSVVRITMKEFVENHENYSFLQDLKKIEERRIKRNLLIKQQVLANINKYVNLGLSRGNKKSFELSENVRVDVDNESMRVLSVPSRDQKKLLRNVKRFANSRTSMFLHEADKLKRSSFRATQKELNLALKTFELRSVKYISYYYESEPNKNWKYVDVRENIPPPPPNLIKIFPNSVKKQILITWLKPPNSQRDIDFFRLYRRNEINEFWDKLGEFREADNIYIDDAVDFDKKYIYALTSVDKHGIESFLSTQIQAELNNKYLKEKREKKLKWISGSGVEPSEINTVFRKFFDQDKPVIVKDSITIQPTLDFNETEKNLIVRIRSLDIAEQKEFKVSLRSLNITT